MDFKEAYRLGQERKGLDLVAQKYDGWPRGLVSAGFSIAEDLTNMTKKIRETARQKAESIVSPENLLGRIGFNLGYFLAQDSGDINISEIYGRPVYVHFVSK
ncbi:MAG: hypothetical protein Q8O84_04110 [Nanoarchaeota archaeon]|nr:hypothetical protein [Nanoarchaeota archaeon]